MEDNEEYKTENELSSELTGLNKGDREKKKKLLIIIGLATVTVLLITIIIIIIIVSAKDNNSNNDNNNNNENLESIAEIKCIYDIQNINENTLLLGNEFIKNTNFDIYINDDKIKYSKEYKFSKTGLNNVKYIIYEDLQMDYLFKDVQDIISVEMISEKECKINSMISAFENAKK